MSKAEKKEEEMAKGEAKRLYVMVNHRIARAVHSLSLTGQRMIFHILIGLEIKKATTEEKFRKDLIKLTSDPNQISSLQVQKLHEARRNGEDVKKVYEEMQNVMGEDFMRLAIIMADEVNHWEKDIEFQMSDLLKANNLSKSAEDHKKILDAIDELMKKSIKVVDDKTKRIEINIIDHYVYDKITGKITIRITDSCLKYTQILKGEYFKTWIDEILGLKGYYSTRLYILGKSWESQAGKAGNKPNEFFAYMEVDELREFLGIPEGKYKRFKYLNDNVLKRAAEEMNKSKSSTIKIKDFEINKAWREAESVKIIYERVKPKIEAKKPIKSEKKLEEQADESGLTLEERNGINFDELKSDERFAHMFKGEVK